jgi:hypothetical protein
MRHQRQRPVAHHRLARQLDLFGLPTAAGCDQTGPLWRVLPEETRQVVTELMVRLLVDHGRIYHRPIRTEAVDDV